MAREISAGLIMYRWKAEKLELLLGHPGGPLYIDKDDGFWGIPKGRVEKYETILDAALREFGEETGINPTVGEFMPLGKIIELQGK